MTTDRQQTRSVACTFGWKLDGKLIAAGSTLLRAGCHVQGMQTPRERGCAIPGAENSS